MGEDCISELQFYKRKNKVNWLCTLQALHTWNRKHIPTQQGISLTIKEQNGRKFRDTAGDKDNFLCCVLRKLRHLLRVLGLGFRV